jgi:hypothetical protein
MKDFYPSPLEINRELIDSIARESYLSTPHEWHHKTREQIFADFREVLDAARAPAVTRAHVPMPTLEEIGAHLHRAANPTPADRAADTLNGEPPKHGPLRYPAMVLLRGI